MASKRKLEFNPKQKPKRLYLIDGAGFYYRAYYGIRHNLTAADGTPTNATYGFATMFRKIIRDEKPDAIAIALDSREKTFRHEMYPEYKANRDAMPEDLAAQIPYIERVIKAHNVEILKRPGLEADDLLACAAQRAVKLGYDVTIVTGDKDLMQLVTDHVTVLDPLKGKRIDAAAVKERFGVPPELLGDMLALMGDKSDNIPGVPGVGEKTAQALINEHRNLENVLKNADKIKKPKLRQSLIDHAQDARLSRTLVELKTDLDMEMDIDSWQLPEPDAGKLRKLFTELNFKSLLLELAELAESAAEPGLPATRRVVDIGGGKQSEPALPEESPEAPQAKAEYSAVLTQKELKKLCVLLESSKGFAVDTETTSTEPMNAKLVGL
ncbi:MAG: 5'-3' exonuclease H3TH domain-containing protein, partial [Nitrospinota bacterium]